MNNNHEIWRKCPQCGEYYDARVEGWDCPKCKTKNKENEPTSAIFRI